MSSKNVQISKELFLGLYKHHVMGVSINNDYVKKELEKKLDALVLRDLYTSSKTASTEAEREEARQQYLNMKGIHQDFRW